MSEVIAVETRGLLFDMDGVLISSIGSVNRCWTLWAKHYNVDVDWALTITHGRRAIDTVKILRPDIDPEAGLRYVEDLEVDDNEDLKILPGVAELLASLPVGCWTIVTSATERLATARLKHAGLKLPEKMITANNVDNGKPHPEPYQRGAAILGLTSAECVVVEDAPSGVGAGKAAGSPVLGLLTSHTAEEIRDADWIIPSLADLKFEATSDGRLRLQFPAMR